MKTSLSNVRRVTLVYNDLLNSNRKRETPHLPFTSARTVVVKYTYTFRL